MAKFLILIFALLIGLSSIFVAIASTIKEPSVGAPAVGTPPLVTWEEFSKAITSSTNKKGVHFGTPRRAQYDAFINGLPKGGPITSKREAAMLLANIMLETAGLKYKKEICVIPGCPGKYETPELDIPGKDYFGRGYIQLTWAENYLNASQELFGDDSLLQNPELVEKEDNAWAVTFFYWNEHVHDLKKVQQGFFGSSTKAINGGECRSNKKEFVENRKQRFEIYKSIMKAFNIHEKPNEKGCYRVSACEEPERRSILSVITCNYDFMLAHTGQLDDDDSSSS